MTTGTFTMAFLGRNTEFTYTVSLNYTVELEFTVAQIPYTFVMTRWSGRGMKKFLPLFFEREPRDEQQFGSMVEDEDNIIYHMTTAQKTNVVIQASKDVLTTVNLIFDVHGKGLVDYCIWYREQYESYDTYAKYITLVCCHNVVHSLLIAPRVTWALVTFPELLEPAGTG